MKEGLTGRGRDCCEREGGRRGGVFTYSKDQFLEGWRGREGGSGGKDREKE